MRILLHSCVLWEVKDTMEDTTEKLWAVLVLPWACTHTVGALSPSKGLQEHCLKDQFLISVSWVKAKTRLVAIFKRNHQRCRTRVGRRKFFSSSTLF